MSKIFTDGTIAAAATPMGEGGISIVKISGIDSLKIADNIFVSLSGKLPSGLKSFTVAYGHVCDPESGEKIDEVILTVMRAPKSYTKEDVVEINCHGGIQSAKRVLDLVVKSGARPAQPGEFTKRAFLNGRIDLTQAEAVLDVIRAKTESSLKAAVEQLEGGLSKEINLIRDNIITILSHIEASIDFPEEGIEPSERSELIKESETAVKNLSDLIGSYDNGMILREGILAIICGKPNVGKSSLMNLLLRRDRVIVSPIPGTTRDAVEEMISLKDIPIRLVDTAGIAKSNKLLDMEGIRRSKNYLKLADLVLLMLDSASGITQADLDIIKLIRGKKVIIILNKIDLKKKINPERLKKFFGNDTMVEISVGKKKNIDKLEKAIVDAVWSGSLAQRESAVVTNSRHKAHLDNAYRCMLSVVQALNEGREAELVAVDLKEAVEELGLITGKTVSTDVLDRIFENFCVGK